MDPINLIYYAVICAILSALSPRVPALHWRLGIGAFVGLVAAGLLPSLKAAIGL